MMYPPGGDLYEEMVRSGYTAFKSWDGRMIRKVGRRQPNHQALYVLWALKSIEFAWHSVLRMLGMLWVLLLWGMRVVFGTKTTA